MWINLLLCSAVLSAVLVAIPEPSLVIEEDPDAPYSGRLYLGTATTASPPFAPEP
ncbi:hypothetical protein [Qipengyuania pacifica]|uniref:hypothetical protein n=1 Tax=Qipengyuania pacifica TaxID=2860199 RepID=UPI001C9E01FF|nr:hypothetical protein [Qipengyuania pacifica]MBY8333490.1 hypothetical protein [Qipengyuania pacifica]